MATPKEQHDTRRGRVTGTDWERRRELELARSRGLAAEHGEPAPPGMSDESERAATIDP